MRKLLCCLLGISLVLLIGTASFAQTSGLEIHGLYAFNADGDWEGADERDFDNTWGLGGSFVFCLNQNVKLDIGADYFAWEYKGSSDKLTLIPITATLRVGGNLDMVFVYGGGGIGYSFNDTDQSGADIDDSLIYHFCGGVELGLSEQIALRGELRYNLIEPEYEETGVNKGDLNLNHMQFRAGLALYF